MATQQDIRNALAKLNQISSVPVQTVKPRESYQDMLAKQFEESESKKSALNNAERTSWGFMNEKAQDKFLKDKFGQQNVSKNPETGRYQVKDPETGITKQIDPKGFEGGDILESVGKGLVMSAQLPAKYIQGMSFGLATPVSGAITGLAETARQTVGNILAKENLSNLDKGEIAMETLSGALIPGLNKATPLVGKGVSKVVERVIDSPLAKKSMQKMDEIIRPIAERVKKAPTPEGVAEVVAKDANPIGTPLKIMTESKKGLTGEEMLGKTLLGSNVEGSTAERILGNKGLMGELGVPKGAPDISDRMLKNAKDDVMAFKDNYKNIMSEEYNKGLKQFNIDQSKPIIRTNNIKQSLNNTIDDFGKRFVTSDEDEKVLKVIKQIQSKLPDKDISLKDTQALKHQIYDAIDSFTDDMGKDTAQSRLLKRLYGVVRESEDASAPQLSKLNSEWARRQEVASDLLRTLKGQKQAGEDKMEKVFMRLAKDKGNQEQQETLEKVNSFFKSDPAFRKFLTKGKTGEFSPVDSIHYAQDLHNLELGSKGVKTGFNPFNIQQSIVSGFGALSPENRARFTQKMIKSGILNPETASKTFGENNLGNRLKAISHLINNPFNSVSIPGLGQVGQIAKTGLDTAQKMAVPVAKEAVNQGTRMMFRESLKNIHEKLTGESTPWDMPEESKDIIPKGLRDGENESQVNSLLSYLNKKNYSAPKLNPDMSTNENLLGYLRTQRGV